MFWLKLIRTLIKVNLQIALAYRVDTVVTGLINIMWLGWELLGLGIIFSNTDTIAGWGPGELVALLGVFRLVNMLMEMIIWPATEKFNTSVRDGSLDYTLLMPVNSQFLVSFGRILPLRLSNLLLAIALITIGIRMSHETISPVNLLYFFLLVLTGMIVIYSLWIFLIGMTFWFVKFDNNVTILQALMDTGRYPATVYPAWLRVIVTYLIPIALATTVPLQGLRGELAGRQVLGFIVIGLAALWASRRFWSAGLRQYSGASS